MAKTQSIIQKLRSFKYKDSLTSFTSRKDYKKSTTYLRAHPFTAFLIALGLLLGAIILGNVISRAGQSVVKPEQVVKDVKVFSLNSAPSIRVQAKVEKEGVIQILAQTAGIVSTVNVTEGDPVSQGSVFVNLSSNYQGGNAPGLQAQLAQTQYNNVADTYSTQKEIIGMQREIADKTEVNAEELRKIASDAADETQSLLDLNVTIMNGINTQVAAAETEGNAEQVFALQQQKSQIQAGMLQLQSQLRQLNYQGDSDKPAAELSILQKDITIKQLEIQEKAVTLSLEVSRIQRDLAAVQASLMAPASPCIGVIERIHVKPGDSVNPGDPIATIKTENNQIHLEALVPGDIAVAVSRTASSSARISSKTFSLAPYYISREATSGQLYSILYSLPETVTGTITNGEFIPVTIPIGVKKASDAPYIPLDAVYQTQNESYVFVVQGDTALSKPVKLGDVYGQFVTVSEGLSEGDLIILDRNVVSGEKITISQ